MRHAFLCNAKDGQIGDEHQKKREPRNHCSLWQLHVQNNDSHNKITARYKRRAHRGCVVTALFPILLQMHQYFFAERVAYEYMHFIT